MATNFTHMYMTLSRDHPELWHYDKYIDNFAGRKYSKLWFTWLYDQCIEQKKYQNIKIDSILIRLISLRYFRFKPMSSHFLYNCARTPTGHTTVKQNPFGERLISTTIPVFKQSVQFWQLISCKKTCSQVVSYKIHVYFKRFYWKILQCSPAGYMPNYCRTPEDEQAAADACALINTLLHPCHTAVSSKKNRSKKLSTKRTVERTFPQ